MYETYHTPSWDWEKAKDHYPGKRYECTFCGCGLEDHEAYMRDDKVYCGCCK
jgi:hypothetical protein